MQAWVESGMEWTSRCRWRRDFLLYSAARTDWIPNDLGLHFGLVHLIQIRHVEFGTVLVQDFSSPHAEYTIALNFFR